MADKKKKMAAALAAVSLYLKEEEIAAEEQQRAQLNQQRSHYSPWADSGRQEMMSFRRLMNLRTFTRL